MKRIISLVLALFIIQGCFLLNVRAEENRDFDIVLERIKDEIYTNHFKFDYDDKWLGLLGGDGKFSDLKYSENTDRYNHVVRLDCMVWEFCSSGGKLYKNSEASSKLQAALKFYVEQKFDMVGTSGNWSNTLEAPQYLAEAMIGLESAGISVPQGILDSAKGHYFDLHMRKEGNAIIFALNTSNLSYTAGLWKRLALLYHDEEYIKRIFDYSSVAWINHASGEEGVLGGDYAGTSPALGISYFGDGYYPDGSYYGHGPLHYNFGYGNQFLIGNAPLVRLAAGTKYQVSEDKLSVLVGLLLDNWRWLMRGDNNEFTGVQRSISLTGDNGRATDGRRGRCITVAENLLAEPNIPRRAELEEFLNKLNENKDSSYVEGNRHYWQTDIMSQQREKYFAMVRLTSTRNLKNERLGENGVNNYYLSDGVAPVFVTGREYQDAFVVWDWDRLPGITTVQSDDDVPALPEHNNFYGNDDFAGGASDGKYGAATMDYSNELGVKAKKSWFFFDDEIVSLGTDIQSTGTKEVYSNINQCILDGDVLYNDGTEKKLDDNAKLSADNTSWIYHGKIGYIVPNGQKVTFSNELQRGNGRRKEQTNYPYFERNIFSMYINHGATVKNGGYSYITVPGISKEELEEYSKDIPVEIVRNDSKIQAVYHKKLDVLEAVFRAPGEVLSLENGLKISVDTPCVLIFKRIDGGVCITVQNPRNNYAEIGVYLNEKIETDKSEWDEKKQMSFISIKTRNGIFAGESVNANLTSKLISNIEYIPKSDVIAFSGIIPVRSAKYIFAKLTDENGRDVIKSSGINSDGTYSFDIDAKNLLSGKYKTELYCENDMERITGELEINRAAEAEGAIFPDTVGHWCRDYASKMLKSNILNGDENGCFKPDDAAKAAEVIKILVKAAEISGKNIETAEFDKSNFSESVMQYALADGFVPKEIIDGNLNGDDLLNRQQAVALIMSFGEKYGLKPLNPEPAESEAPQDLETVNYWAHKYVLNAFESGIICGNENNEFRPFDLVSRAEVIKMISIMCDF